MMLALDQRASVTLTAGVWGITGRHSRPSTPHTPKHLIQNVLARCEEHAHWQCRGGRPGRSQVRCSPQGPLAIFIYETAYASVLRARSVKKYLPSSITP